MKQPSHWLFMLCISMVLLPQLHANDRESILLFSITSQNTARLGIVNPSKRNVDLVITNREGATLFHKSVSGQENYFQLFSLNNMPDGEYKVSLQNLEEIDSKRFIIQNTRATLLTEQKEKAPVFRLFDEESLIISYLNSRENSVNIFFMRGDEVVFEDRGLTGLGISKRYSLKQLPQGEYEVRLYSAGQIYTFPLVKK